jgi:hypothetical protein
MPTTPPRVENRIEENEKTEAPQRLGITPPRVEPIKRNSQMRDLVFMSTFA